MQQRTTTRGFEVIEFKDRYGSDCSLQESSLATEGAIWFGVDRPFDGEIGTRMHLTQGMVEKLLPMLIYFSEHGYLPKED